jgi:hypothetical protein
LPLWHCELKGFTCHQRLCAPIPAFYVERLTHKQHKNTQALEKIMSAIETEKKEDLKVTVEGSTCSTKTAEEKAAEAKANTCSTDASAKPKEEKKGSCCG